MKSRFMAKPSPEYTEAVAKLRQLGFGTSDRAYAEAVHEEIKETWAKGRGLRESKAHPCIRRLLGKRCNYGMDNDPPCAPPAADHPSLWLRNGKPAVYMFQPYGLSGKDLQELVDFAKRWHLELSIDSRPSWHFPGSTVAVTLWEPRAYREWALGGHAAAAGRGNMGREAQEAAPGGDPT